MSSRITVGTHVDIKRSDGRVHGAIVSRVNSDGRSVVVEWFEKGETKGKEMDVSSLLKLNPMLASTTVAPPPISSNGGGASSTAAGARNGRGVLHSSSADDDNNINDVSFVMPEVALRSGNNRAAASSQRTAASGSRNSMPVARHLPNTLATAASLNISQQQHDLNEDTMLLDGLDLDLQQQPAQTAATAARRPRRANNDAVNLRPSLQPTTSAAPPVAAVQPTQQNALPKGPTVRAVEKLEKEREERRAAIKNTKKAQQDAKSIDPGNPNWQFLSMIREYRASVDYRPLQISDSVADNRISVCVRKRPLSKKEITLREIEVVTIPTAQAVIVHQPQTKVDLTKFLENQRFRFDYAFDENVENSMVYRFTAQPLVRTIFDGGFATCFAYGQTGSGKTHTMGGDFAGKSQDCSRGIYALTATDVFRLISSDYRHLKLQVVCSFFEIYGGKVFDLLANKKLLRVLEDGKKEVQVVGLAEESVVSDHDVLDLIRRGTAVRTSGSTSANSNSSRSHAVFQIILRHSTSHKLHGKFSLIDLAGNERGADTGAADSRTRMEGAEINKSLLALKECIRAMGRSSEHVPFRASKLTLVLRDSFVGQNARTCMISCISPGMASCEHTLNTLRYADRVKELDADGERSPSPSELEVGLVPGARNGGGGPDNNGHAALDTGHMGDDPTHIRLWDKIEAAEDGTIEALENLTRTGPDGMVDATRELTRLIGIASTTDYDIGGFANQTIDVLTRLQSAVTKALAETNLLKQAVDAETDYTMRRIAASDPKATKRK